jgi:hypothetical protein
MIGGMVIQALLAVLVPLAAALVPPPAVHPHHPKAVVVGGAGGKATFLYFTVPHNPDRLADLQEGFQWHLGFAWLDSKMPLRSGESAIPAGRYKLDVRRGASGNQWSAVLVDGEWAEASNAVRRVKRGGSEDDVAAAEAKLAAIDAQIAAGERTKERVLAMTAKSGDDAEHLTFTALHHGFATVRMGSDEPAGGAEFSLRIDFGDIHQELAFVEVFEQDTKKGAR